MNNLRHYLIPLYKALHGKAVRLSQTILGEGVFCILIAIWDAVYSIYLGLIGWPLLFHMAAMISLAWLAGSFHFNFLFMLVMPMWYLGYVHGLQKVRLELQIHRKLEVALARDVHTTDVETVVWLNALIQESWMTWLEAYVSKKLHSILQYSLSLCKPRAVSKLVVDRVRIGSSPFVIKSAKVYRNTTDDKDVILELDVSFIAAEDMSVDILACLSRGASMGLGLTGKLYADNLRIEGKLRLGLSVRPLSSSSVNIADLPGAATWVSKALTSAVEAFLVEPYSYVVDLLAIWGTDFGLSNETGKSEVEGMNEVGFAIVEILEGRNLQSADLTG
eukprot:Gb_23903 [translate_table: standard]